MNLHIDLKLIIQGLKCSKIILKTVCIYELNFKVKKFITLSS